MTISGRLQDFSFTDLVQTIATGQKSGKLHLSSIDSDGLIVFRKGAVIYAASSSIRETLGSSLIRKSLVSQSELDEALRKQYQAGKEKRLGTVLIEMGVVSQESITEIIAEQTARVFSEFMAWPEGHFTYNPVEFADRGEIEVDGKDLISEEGFRTDQMLLEIASRLDELDDQKDITRDSFATVTPPPLTGQSRTQEDADQSETSLPSLKSLIEEIRSPHFTGEISNKIASFAQGIFERWILFMVARNGFRMTDVSRRHPALSQGRERSTELMVPSDEPSVLAEVLSRKKTIIGALKKTEWNDRILESVGGQPVETSVVSPLIVNGQVLLVLYGGQLRSSASLRRVDELEVLFMQIGLTIERDLFERRVEHLEALRSKS